VHGVSKEVSKSSFRNDITGCIAKLEEPDFAHRSCLRILGKHVKNKDANIENVLVKIHTF